MPSIEWNRRVWGEKHDWREAGDEWSGMAAHCGQPYQDWKDALVRTFIDPVPAGARILEIAPGHGRWTGHLLERAGVLTLADINQSCLDSCRERFDGRGDMRLHLTDGRSLDFQPPGSVDFVWSFDAFVHMDPEVIEAYLHEIGRVLAPGGRAVLHHADKPDWSLRLVPVTRRAGRPGRVLQRLVSQRRWRDDGARSHVSAALVARWARAAGLDVAGQVDSWGDAGQFTVRKYHDRITLLAKPAPPTDQRAGAAPDRTAAERP